MLGFAVLLELPHLWRHLPHTGPGPLAVYACWTPLALVLSVLPFTFYRMASPYLPGFLSTLSLPLYGVAFMTIKSASLPAGIAGSHTQGLNRALLQSGAVFGASAVVFLVDWIAAVTVWTWNHEFRAATIRTGASISAAACALAVGFGLLRQLRGNALPPVLPVSAAFAWVSVTGAVALSGWALFRSGKDRGWICTPEALSILQSPATGEPLHLVQQGDGEVLTSPSGERFPIRDGIPDLRRPEDLTGFNQKYNRLFSLHIALDYGCGHLQPDGYNGPQERRDFCAKTRPPVSCYPRAHRHFCLVRLVNTRRTPRQTRTSQTRSPWCRRKRSPRYHRGRSRH